MSDFEKIPLDGGMVDSEKEKEFEQREAQLRDLLQDPVLRIVALDIIASENAKDEADERKKREKRVAQETEARDIVLKIFGDNFYFGKPQTVSDTHHVLGVYDKNQGDAGIFDVDITGLNGQGLYNLLASKFHRDPNKEAQEG